ncbi:MAG: DNA repair protein RecO [Pseudomonadota bacterium]
MRALNAAVEEAYVGPMEWNDDGIVLSVRRHGETGAIAEIFTRAHGRHLGFVHGGQSRRLRPILQAGNHVQVAWRARLADNMGHFSLELERGVAAQVMADPLALSGVTSLAALAQLLPERDAHAELYEVTEFVLQFIDDPTIWPALYVRWELALLQDMGVGLDLSSCAATGRRDDLIYVSPRSGRAVSRDAGQPYADRMFTLPPFLRPGDNRETTAADIAGALEMTGHFLMHRIYGPDGTELPEPRQRFERRVRRLGERC